MSVGLWVRLRCGICYGRLEKKKQTGENIAAEKKIYIMMIILIIVDGL